MLPLTFHLLTFFFFSEKRRVLANLCKYPVETVLLFPFSRVDVYGSHDDYASPCNAGVVLKMGLILRNLFCRQWNIKRFLLSVSAL